MLGSGEQVLFGGGAEKVAELVGCLDDQLLNEWNC